MNSSALIEGCGLRPCIERKSIATAPWEEPVSRSLSLLSSTPLLQISLLKGTFQDSVANLYNDLPASISSITDDHNFVKESAKILKAKAIMRLAGLISMSGNFIILIFMILYLSVNNM